VIGLGTHMHDRIGRPGALESSNLYRDSGPLKLALSRQVGQVSCLEPVHKCCLQGCAEHSDEQLAKAEGSGVQWGVESGAARQPPFQKRRGKTSLLLPPRDRQDELAHDYLTNRKKSCITVSVLDLGWLH